MPRPNNPILYLTALAMTGLLHCSSHSSEPSKTAADESSSGSMGQTNSAEANSSSSGASDAQGGSSPSAGAKNLGDPQIAAITDAANSAEIEQGRLAQSKATDPRVRSFAAMMVEHHGEARRDQQALSVSKQESADSERMSKDADSALSSLQQKSGADFDRAYIQLQCDEHRKVLNDIDQKLLPAAKDPALRAYLEKLKPKVQEHLAQAERLQKDLGSSSSRASETSPAQRSANR
jgi:putative membrane protein